MSKIPSIEFSLLLPYRRCGGFWERDGGLLALEGRRQGLRTALVLLTGATVEEEGKPLVTGTPAEMADPDWWRSRAPDMVVLYAWGMPRYAPVAKAIRSAGIRLQVQFDSDGIISPRVDAWRYFYTIYWTYRERGFKNRFRLFPSLTASLNLIWHWVNPHAYDRPMVNHLEQADWIALESLLAARRVKGFLRRMGRAELEERVVVSPHPVDNRFQYRGGAKRPKIIAIGRWDSPQKDPGLLKATLRIALLRHAEWTATLIGPGGDVLTRSMRGWPAALRSRIQVCGRRPHEALPEALQDARILVASSRYESFHIAAAEALCCGASVVGPACLASFHWFTSAQSGSLSATRQSGDLADALSAEIRAWEAGRRNPEAIAQHWTPLLKAEACVKALVARLAAASERSNPGAGKGCGG
ncbi:MAG: glycosyltransferase [Kiritimatiellia bacterium]